jgi:hypothetical protein
MSWRALIIFLLLAVVASWQGGRQFGLWLVEQAPESIASASNPGEDRRQVLDADGKPLAPQPPQPRIDGTLGVPREMEPIEWNIAPVLASRDDANSYKKDGDEDEEDEDAEQDEESRSNNNDPDSVRTVDVRAQTASSQTVRPGATAPTQPSNWQDALKKELAQCNSVGFFKRPSCIQSAQNKFCGPNNAWGKVTECPSRDAPVISGG